MMKPSLFPILLLALAPIAVGSPNNLVRNGSFEGALLYWHNQKGTELVDAGRNGSHALAIHEGYVVSAPMLLERDSEYTISLWARSKEGSARVNIGLPPMAREVAQAAGRIWTKGATQSEELTSEWQRVSVTFRTDVKPTGFWPLPSYGVTIGGDKSGTILVDGVTVVAGGEGTADYVPRTAVEVVAEPTNLPGYAGAAGNMYRKGATATLEGHISNPGDTSQNLTVRWQLMDYEGEAAHAEPVDTKLTLAAGATEAVPVSMPLVATGTVIARVSVFNEDGARVDSSDMPLTSLPYEKSASVPDADERFGGSFAGGVECLERMQRIGFGWTRWWANQKWHDYEPAEGRYEWSNDKFEEAWSRGISTHVVLYGWPEWIMDKEHPLPRDMRWKADDPRWEDLSVVTAWDRFVVAAAKNFRGKPVIFQIANEPGHDKWLKDGNNLGEEYVKFTLRTARLLKRTDPEAQVSLNNVYQNPSSVNGPLLATGEMADFDVWSWHDYHSGRLGDETMVKRMESMLGKANAGHLEIWFTEGWAFTNTLVDQPPGPTGLTSVESTHAIMNSVAEMTAAGHDKFVLFHLMYGTHGMSFWDYSGPGTMIYDWYDYPTALVGGWNVLNHHIGLSEQIGIVRPPGGTFTIFTDLRNRRGVMIGFADANATEDVEVPLPVKGLTAEDLQGNPVKLEGERVTLKKSGRPVILYTVAGGDGRALHQALEPADRKHLGFVSSGEDGSRIYRLPESWEGEKAGASDGNPALDRGQPIWRLDRLYPQDAILPGNYQPMVWGNQRWEAPDHTHGGHPSAELKDGVLRLGTMGPWSGELDFRKQGALVFIVPDNGVYHIRGTVRSAPWGGSTATAYLRVMKRDEQRVGEIEKIALNADGESEEIDIEVDAAKGHELLLLAEMPNHNNSTNVIITDLEITRR